MNEGRRAGSGYFEASRGQNNEVSEGRRVQGVKIWARLRS